MKTFLDIMKILLTKDGNRLIFAILCADVVALFFIRCIIAWLVLVFCCAYLIWSLIIFLFQRYRSYREKQKYKRQNAKKEADDRVMRKNLAKDLFHTLEYLPKQLLCYAILKGKKSSTFLNVWMFNDFNELYPIEINKIDSLRVPHYPQIEFTKIQTNYRQTSIMILPELVELIMNEITNNRYTLQKVVKNINKYYDMIYE
ncbi:hypothetical protein [uncultured Prevotella sp.]|uniref:hypothetical protein n=1 Tax=uncultured Prevotella sp. TaxID=159272 RepID=UPI0027E35D76|nr:hypothetical protein [uncultured Prevotella sp.]